MKNILKIFIILFISFCFSLFTFAQTPNQFKYQAILRDGGGNVLANQNKTVVIDILQETSTGKSVFSESNSLTTTAQGLINLNIGSLENLSGIFWSNGDYFIKITIDGVEMGTSQLLSVPYALQAREVENVNYSQITNTPTLFDGNYNSLTNLPTLFSGSFADLSNKPKTIEGYGITDAFNGNYNSLTNKPAFTALQGG